MNRTTSLLLVAGCLAVAALAYWNNLPVTMLRQSLAPAQVTAPPVTPTPAPAAPTIETPAASPSKPETPPTAPGNTTLTPANKKAPARPARREQPSTVTAERTESVAPPVEPAANHSPAPPPAPAPSRAEEYEALAAVSLKNKDYAQAREQIASALAQGGKATFSVIHDHSRGNFDATDTKATCTGELIILADELRFEAGSGDRFSANWAELRDAGSNKFFGSGIGGFHLTINAGGKYKNVNLAPESKDKAEGKLILELLNAGTHRRDRTK